MCCAPCSTYSIKRFRELGYFIHGYFYNPNIHPYKEFQRRLETLESYCLQEEIPLTVQKSYELELFLQRAIANIKERCRECYTLRLTEAARKAAELGFEQFSTTLTISPYQNHDLLKEVGEVAAARYGVKFIYEDLRPGYKESIELSKNNNLYRQPYCGCIFSEKDRYYKEGK
ncbi:MAG: epoxyqueuosine reductase QueH [Firmicutes bacterium]|nr:epoxyqueuosine reductase QueH [Bacillota bacterium]